MKASEAGLLDFLRKAPQFVIPIYQRPYSWTEQECRQLWNDIVRVGARDDVTGHFIGSIVYIEKGLSQVVSQSPLLVIDGQQRITTVMLIIAALVDTLERQVEADREPIDGFSPLKLRHYYLTNPLESGERRYKLILSQTDKESLLAIVSGHNLPLHPSVRITENYRLFTSLINDDHDAIDTICKGLAKLIVVDIALNRDQDNPQLIFESMNSTGRELSQADLIRNFILMGLEPETQTWLYEQYWRLMEIEFGQQAYTTHFDAFIRHYLTFRTGDIPNVRDVYEAFKNYARRPEIAIAGTEALVRDIREFARYYCVMALGVKADPNLGAHTEVDVAFQDLRELKVDVAYPLLLELYSDYATHKLAPADFLAAVRLIESYVFRRAICAIPTNSLNKTFSTFGKALRKGNYLESVQAHFLTLPSYRRFPSDGEFRRDIQQRDLYKFPRRTYWLRRIENFERKELVLVDDFTIEHILPQNPNLSEEWQAELGPEWKRIQETYLHTLGNLTLTGYNSEYGDRPFAYKRDRPGGFSESPLKLNQGLGQLAAWNEDAIVARASKLADRAIRVWPSPNLADGVVDAYVSSTLPKPMYTIENHPYLLNPPLRALFDAFRSSALALDPCVTEEFLKVYIAYKAETNFVDVVPLQTRLRLTLNMPFPNLVDPRSLGKDVTDRAGWGNGDVEIELTSLDELPYVMSLVRQSFERQMGSGDGT